MISIEFSVVNGRNLDNLLESVRTQTYQDYEIVVVTSNDKSHDLLKQYGATVIEKHTGKLEARYLAHSNSKGDFEFILEETRILRPDALEKLFEIGSVDMAIVREKEIGNNLINKLNRLDMQIGSLKGSESPDSLYVLPRYFRREVLAYGLEKAYENIPPELIPKIVSSDMEMIYFEAYNKYRYLASVETPLIEKNGEKSVMESMTKYFRYGKTQKLLKNTKYEKSLGVKGRFRKIPSLRYIPAVMAIYAIRGLPYLAGYYL